MLVFPSGRRGETTGVPPEPFSGGWGNRGLASPRESPVDVQAFLSGVFSKSDRFGVTNISGDPIFSWWAAGERQLISDSGGLSERAEARRFPLPLTSVCEREGHETLLSWTCETSVGLCELFGLLESSLPESAGLRSGRIFHS
jgi:hypothetical protein